MQYLKKNGANKFLGIKTIFKKTIDSGEFKHEQISGQQIIHIVKY